MIGCGVPGGLTARHGSAATAAVDRARGIPPRGAPDPPLHVPPADPRRPGPGAGLRGECLYPDRAGPDPARAISSRPRRSATPARRRTSSAPTRTEPAPLGWSASEAACKPSSVPRLASRGRSSICGRRSPDGSCGRPEGWAAHLSPRRTGVAPSYLALLRVEFAAFHSAARLATEPAGSSLWHWSSPRGGRALPATLR